MTPEEQYAAFKARQAAKAAGRVANTKKVVPLCAACRKPIDWHNHSHEHGYECERCLKRRVLADGGLPPGITTEE